MISQSMFKRIYWKLIVSYKNLFTCYKAKQILFRPSQAKHRRKDLHLLEEYDQTLDCQWCACLLIPMVNRCLFDVPRSPWPLVVVSLLNDFNVLQMLYLNRIHSIEAQNLHNYRFLVSLWFFHMKWCKVCYMYIYFGDVYRLIAAIL